MGDTFLLMNKKELERFSYFNKINLGAMIKVDFYLIDYFRQL